MELIKHGRLECKGQDDTTITVRVCFQGEQDRIWYCKEMTMPKAELVSITREKDSTGMKLSAAYMPPDPLISDEEAERWRHDNPELHERNLFEIITAVNSEADVCAKVDELRPEYVHDWEDEFDDFEEAYAEQGRGAAESQVIGELVKSYGPDLTSDAHAKLFDRLAEHYGLSTT